jgi:hypothetical protein
MSLKSTSKKAEPGSGFDSHLVSMEEAWWIRDHPFNTRCVRVKQGIRRVTELEDQLDRERKQLEYVVEDMNKERLNAKH